MLRFVPWLESVKPSCPYVFMFLQTLRSMIIRSTVLILGMAFLAPSVKAQTVDEADVVEKRVEAERRDAFNRYVITAHKQNFVLPLSYTSNINRPTFNVLGQPEVLDYQSAEVNFQISLKSLVNQRDLIFANDALFFGLTIESWWQLYSPSLSSPFRETNYQPEIFYVTPLLWGPFGGTTALTIGLEHQSNGQTQALSRSWNRVYTTLIYGKGNFVASVRPWYRIPEDLKENPSDAEGDDNPDIEDFFGFAELTLGWKAASLEMGALVRGNVATEKGALDATVTFPLTGNFRGMVNYFVGYGDSLIDYDRFQHRVGVGIALTNLF